MSSFESNLIPPIQIEAIDLDIRNLSHTQDSIKIGDGIDLLSVNLDGSINITDNGGSLTIDGSVSAVQSGTWNIGTLGTITNVVHIDDNSGSLTVDGAITANQGTSPWIISGTVSTNAGTGLATVSRISVGNTVAVTLSLSNSAKTQVIIYNEGGTLFVKFGPSASSTSFTFTMTPDSVLEVNGYFGLITARKLSGTTFVDVTEVGI